MTLKNEVFSPPFCFYTAHARNFWQRHVWYQGTYVAKVWRWLANYFVSYERKCENMAYLVMYLRWKKRCRLRMCRWIFKIITVLWNLDRVNVYVQFHDEIMNTAAAIAINLIQKPSIRKQWQFWFPLISLICI